MTDSDDLDYLVIGHVTRDRIAGGGWAVGGTAAYAARTALAMGLATGVITSGPEELVSSLEGARVLRVDSPVATTFDNRYTPAGRIQTVRTVAAPLTPELVPPAWRRAGVVHLGPVAGECSPDLASLFPGVFLGLTPQGWMRCWDEKGRVRRAEWQDAGLLLQEASAVVLSEEDVEGDESLVASWATIAPVLVVTRGAAGCTLYARGQRWAIPGFPALEVDPTGAGDIFAAVFFARLWQGEGPYQAAWLANCVAAASVERRGLREKVMAADLLRCQALCA